MDAKDLEQPPAKKTRNDVSNVDLVNPHKTTDPLLLRSLQRVRHLLNSKVKSKYDIKTREAMQSLVKHLLNRPNGRKIMTLNDDCLMELFDSMKPMDFAHFALTCVRLNKLAKRYIQAKYKIRFAPNFNMIASDQTVRIKEDVFQAFLCIFGNDIVTLTIHNNIFDESYDEFKKLDEIERSIQKYCHLKELTFIDFEPCRLTEQFYYDLESLTLQNCSTKKCWASMRNLKTLKLNTLVFRQYPAEFEKYSPKSCAIFDFYSCFFALEELQLFDVNIGNSVASRLIDSTNFQLKRLSIVNCRCISRDIFIDVGKAISLEEFEYKKKQMKREKTKYTIERCFTALMSLKNLKALKLFCHETRMSTFISDLVQNGITLDHLELGLCSFKTKAIAKMSTIKILKLNEMVGLNESHIVNIAKQLKSLEELQVKTKETISPNGIEEVVRAANRLQRLKIDAPDVEIDVVTYQTLLDIIQKREINNNLELTIYGDGKQLTVRNDILNENNEKWLTVKELNRDENHMFEDLKSKIGRQSLLDHFADSDSSDDDDYEHYICFNKYGRY